MREILFRGKHIHSLKANEHLDGTWVYGYLCDKNYINSPELEGELLIDPSTVGQYTGLTDKNGKRIFEGDICKIFGLVYKVEFKYSGWQLTILSRTAYCYPEFNSHCGEYCEVIGNIHDNPELIENA